MKSFVYAFSKRKRQRDFVKFADKLLKRWHKVLLFVDNGPCHHGKIVDKFKKSHRKTFRLEFFPDIFTRSESSGAMLETRPKEIIEPFPSHTGGREIPSFD